MAKIYIDPGHNPAGADTGASGYGRREEDITVEIGQRLSELLKKNGHTVFMSRQRKTDIVGDGSLSQSLSARAEDANQKGADVFVSIHCNAANGKASGSETYAFPGSVKGRLLARCIQNALSAMTGRVDRGCKEASFAVLRNTAMPAVLVETAFIDHYDDSVYLASAAGQQTIAEAIARGISGWLGTEFVGGDFVETQKTFSDIEGHYAKQHIEKLAAYGIVNGDENGKFRPNAPLTRGDAAIMVANALTVCGK